MKENRRWYRPKEGYQKKSLGTTKRRWKDERGDTSNVSRYVVDTSLRGESRREKEPKEKSRDGPNEEQKKILNEAAGVEWSLTTILS